MLDIFTQFERSAQACSPMVLRVPGLVSVLLGIFLWLGGSLSARTSVAMVWLLLVAAIGFFFVTPLVSVGMGVMVFVVAMLLKRFSAGLLTSLLLTFVVFVTACEYTGGRGEHAARSSRSTQTPAYSGETLDASDTFEHLKLMVSGVYRSAVRVGQTLEVKYQVVVGVTAFFALMMGCVLQRPAQALSCAAAGVLLIWGGMLLMLLSKGAMPLTGLLTHAHTCAAMVPVMIAVGTLEQLMFCSRPARKDQGRKADAGKKGK
ncbi:MAG: hypothetical protein GY809_09425 [Planctomycetes bacterium]|nr:hypothetical protein [Planctomycetota bacterium]